ncbi:ABATE domain-containing protein [Kineococcus sp. SYSU DK006]|uniref:ABATE domain-containing protein n=1 Tax=Kineococcus sp. SYSU DK006 TaxID=3383127 RepID=UPI003D7C7397
MAGGDHAEAEAVLVLPSEPRPVRLMNTIWADRDGVHDSLTTSADLARWLQATGLALDEPSVGTTDLRAALALRDALRRLAALRTRDARPAARSATQDLDVAVRVINETAAAGPPRDALHVVGEELHLRPTVPTTDSTAALAAVAAESIALLTAPGTVLNACHAPGCVLYFVKDHPRRGWCSTACGNRARAARHYRRHHPIADAAADPS